MKHEIKNNQIEYKPSKGKTVNTIKPDGKGIEIKESDVNFKPSLFKEVNNEK